MRQAYIALVVLAALLQLLFFGRAADNGVSTLLALASSWLGINAALNGRRFRAHPISALILLFYTTTATSGALLVKTLEWSPLAGRLTVPVLTFSVLFATQLVLLAADHVYLRVQPLHALRRFVDHRLLQPIGLMRWPTDGQLWMLGLLGCASVVLTGTDYESGASFGIASAGEKLIRAFGFLKYAPFLIPFRDAMSGVPSRVRLPLFALGLYFAALVGISFATNSRSTFADAVPTVGICVLLAKALGRLDLRRVPPARLLLIALAAMIAAVLLSRVALAMVVVRDYRYSVDVGMLVQMTIEAFFNNEWLAAAKAKMDVATYVGDYSEAYVDSRFAARFLLTKFHDNILYYLSLFGEDHTRHYKEFMLDRLMATMPDPLLRVFGISIDKQDLVVSNGDYIVYMVDGWGLGGFKTGSMIAEVFWVYGWAFPIVIVVSALMLFVFHDAFVTPAAPGRLAISPLILLLIWNLVGTTAAFGLGAETVTAIPAGIVRGLPQNVLVYVIAVALVKGVSRVTGFGAR
ncbi:MAG: hypothetical protein ABI781_00510 [Burkholderiales bacterium]